MDDVLIYHTYHTHVALSCSACWNTHFTLVGISEWPHFRDEDINYTFPIYIYTKMMYDIDSEDKWVCQWLDYTYKQLKLG